MLNFRTLECTVSRVREVCTFTASFLYSDQQGQRLRENGEIQLGVLLLQRRIFPAESGMDGYEGFSRVVAQKGRNKNRRFNAPALIYRVFSISGNYMHDIDRSYALLCLLFLRLFCFLFCASMLFRFFFIEGFS